MTFAEQFARSLGKPIEYEGQLVHAIYRRAASSGLKVCLRWISSVDSPIQGISISVRGGLLKVAETKAKDIVLWRDSAPDEVHLECVGRNVREILIWNCWRDGRGVSHAWVGNAGMQLYETDRDKVHVNCNSQMLITFEDLAFELIFEG